MLSFVKATVKNGYTEYALAFKKVFLEVYKESEVPFYCPYCTYQRQEKEITTLKSTIDVLQLELTELRSSSNTNTIAVTEEPSQPSYAHITQSVSDESSVQPGSSTVPHIIIRSPDRKFKIVVYGIAECTKGSQKHVRLSKDTESVSELLNSMDTGVTTHSIQDCIRLGRYSESKNRPILVKLSRAQDVSSILSKRYKLTSIPGISIKADMFREERITESILLSQRWKLITDGVLRANIRIRGKSLYVNKKIHGTVTNSVYVRLAQHRRVQALHYPRQRKEEISYPQTTIRSLGTRVNLRIDSEVQFIIYVFLTHVV